MLTIWYLAASTELRAWLILLNVVFYFFAAGAAAEAPIADRWQMPLVYLRQIDPTIRQDMRYASSDNFTGAPVPGYAGPECMLLRPVADALKQVQADLRPRNLSLKVYDCYRPETSVSAFAAWARHDQKTAGANRFYPRVDKSQLFALGYIANRSSHSRGNAVDLTIVTQPTPSVSAFDPTANYGPCTGPSASRAPDDSVDMGTGFDCFDILSYTKSSGITDEQRGWRRVLADAMARRAFHNYPREWWHFTFEGTDARRSFNFPIIAIEAEQDAEKSGQ
jgi:D-alanyl-D-alanine dipeptidase